jgi:peptidoglycan pentaglycine glycine transferase (the first glycine)
MPFQIKEIKEKRYWEDFLKSVSEKTFLNSWNWGEFQERLGNKIWRLGVFDGDDILASALVLKIKAKRGTFLFLPHCPNIKDGKKDFTFEILKTLLDFLKKLSKEEKADFIRVAPIQQNNKRNKEYFSSLKFREAPLHIHPEITFEKEITFSEEVLLSKMRKTTRYLIKKLEKDTNFFVKEENNLEGLKLFYQIYDETKERQKFSPYSFEYLREEFFSFIKDGSLFLLLGFYKGEVVSGGIFIVWQGTCYYHHGASSQKFSKLSTSYSLLWEAIKKAKKLGCQKFNFWGIAPKNYKMEFFNLKLFPHPWLGLTIFKTGFGGERKEYLRTQDFPLSFKYWFNFLVETLRKIKRNL